MATIHSPTAYAFSLFDRLMMLVRGEVVYFGGNGQPAVDYVRSSCPMIKEKAAGYNDAEWLVRGGPWRGLGVGGLRRLGCGRW